MQEVGIVHFGLGAFARAHLAAYNDAAMATGETGWMIAGVSLRSDRVARQLNPQAGLYTLTERSGEGQATRVIGSLREVLVKGRDCAKIVARLASPECHVVSFTVTEKGYCRDAVGGLDHAIAVESFYPLLTQGLGWRMAAGMPGLTLMSCDNLPENGRVLARLLGSWLERDNPALAAWVRENCTFPSTMVDRIVPATSDTDRATLAARLGVVDEGAVVTERFSQWVIEDSFAGQRPNWEAHGAEIVTDVAPYEAAKLRMLNGAHSLLAYAGLAAGHIFVHEAMRDERIRPLVEVLMRQEAAPTVTGLDGGFLSDYATQLIARFDNPALDHRLAQIAMDGSQKVPQRWLATLADARGHCIAILTGIAAWLLHIARGRHLDDPLAEELRDAISAGDVSAQLERLFGPRGLLKSGWVPGPEEVAFIAEQRRIVRTWGGE
ncbi:mannitol dehydrogenase family protein [Alteraurantiacibacter aquimixticola]|uniref:Mannitol dehydrogenase family protein n=2 Tax=Alteraurantiacibacter aquimixticola TaxID=2489173 RepID=A0A4T3F6C6_9SPHN|nr:mannitol dehydrogenase family protein [Alteraurantiacibacter aquimixticola]